MDKIGKNAKNWKTSDFHNFFLVWSSSNHIFFVFDYENKYAEVDFENKIFWNFTVLGVCGTQNGPPEDIKGGFGGDQKKKRKFEGIEAVWLVT